MDNKNRAISIISDVISEETEIDNRIFRLQEALILYFGLNDEDVDDMLDIIRYASNDRKSQEFLGAVFLRLYKNHEDLFEDKLLKHKIITLFDTLYEHSIYKKKKIIINMQSHEKLPLLKQHIEEIEVFIKKINIENLSQFNSFRQKYLKLLKSNKNIIEFFLDEKIYNLLEDIFAQISFYIENHDIDTFNKLKKDFTLYIDNLKKISSEYNTLFLLEPFKKINELIENDLYTHNPDAKISKLIVSSTGKRYPLQNINTHIDLLIKLTNVEEGKAYDTEIEIVETNSLKIGKIKQFIGTVGGKQVVRVKFNAEINQIHEVLTVRVKVSWKDYTQEKYEVFKNLTFNRQRIDIDWEEFAESECYSREAIEDEGELIGRKDILDELYKGLDKNKNIKSYAIHGQKRVGKTSIAKVLKSRLDMNKKKFLVLYIEGGEYVDGENFKNTINNLGNKICKQILRSNQKLSHLEIPQFNGSLQPLVDFLDDVQYILEDLKIIFMLDEFDEISSNLYKRNEIGNAFFLTIRSISNKSNYSFILIGGEKINFIISIQGEQLNKFKSHRVDYFDKEHWSEFKDLVKVPVRNYLDITDEAINKLYEQTAGNPFFTNVICETMMEIAIERRDSFITDVEMEEAIKKSIEMAETQIFLHFWEDGIKEDNEKEEEVSYKRRKVLLVLSELENNNKSLTRVNITDMLSDELGEIEVKKILKEFVERTILIENNEHYSFRIDFFKQWLVNNGSKEIIMTLSDEEKIKIREKEEKEAAVTSEELNKLIKSKKLIYDGHMLDIEDVRRWLNQFETNINQRLVFKILENLIYFNSINIKTKMKEIFSYIKEKKYQGKRVSNVLVSYLDTIGKSGVEYSKYFVEENSVLAKNAVEKNKILNRLNDDSSDFKYLVFIDDFVGTGKSIVNYIKALKKDYPEIFKKTNIEIIIGVISGFLEAKDYIESEFEKMKIKNIKIIICEPLTQRDKCFSDDSKIFINADERRNAKDLCWDKGYTLVKNNPLGFGNCQVAIIFPETCPNNCLPILWAENETFTPLFKRKIN